MENNVICVKDQITGSYFCNKGIKCERNNFTKSTNLMKIVSLPQRMTWWFFFGWAIKCSIFISVKDMETQGYFQCPITHLTQVIIGCMV